MRFIRIRYLLALLLYMSSNLTVTAQYNPDNPPEPGDIDNLLRNTVVVSSNIPEAGIMGGSGKYANGESVTIWASANTGYKFLHWKIEGSDNIYNTSAQFSYTMTSANVSFVAVFEKAKSVNVKVSDEKAGTVSGSTSTIYKGGYTTVSTTPKTNYEFLYWQKNDDPTPFSTAKSFKYIMDDESVTFTAIYKYVKPEYNPENPLEPGDISQQINYRVTVGINDADAGIVSGSGKYKYGKTITISTSANAGYEFRGWLKNGADYSTAQSFEYTVDTEDVSFVAVYEYVGIPEPTPTSHKLYLQALPAGSCTFNIVSGTDVNINAQYSVTVTPGMEYDFIGWYNGTSLVSTNRTYTSNMLNDDITLTARLMYNPEIPDEPFNDDVPEQSMLDLGDVNGDGKVSISDITTLISYLKGSTPSNFNSSVADVDKNEKIDVNDVSALRNLLIK